MAAGMRRRGGGSVHGIFIAGIAAVALLCTASVWKIGHDAIFSGERTVLESKASFWNEEGAIWGKPAAATKKKMRPSASSFPAVKSQLVMSKEPVAARREHGVSDPAMQEVLSPERIYDVAFHKAFHKAFAKTYGQSLGEEEGRLAAQAKWAETQMSSMRLSTAEETGNEEGRGGQGKQPPGDRQRIKRQTFPDVKAPAEDFDWPEPQAKAAPAATARAAAAAAGSSPRAAKEAAGGAATVAATPKTLLSHRTTDPASATPIAAIAGVGVSQIQEEEEEEEKVVAKRNSAATSGVKIGATVGGELAAHRPYVDASALPETSPQDIRHFLKPSVTPPQQNAAVADDDNVPQKMHPLSEPRHFPFGHKRVGYRSQAIDGMRPAMGKGPEYTGGEEHYSPTVPHCPGGNCAPLEAHGVNVDSWRSFGTPRTLAWPGLDPSADPVAQRAQNRRVGRWAKYDTGENPGRWGEAAEPLDDPTAYRLERHGVNVMGDEATNALLFRGMPLPHLDRNEAGGELKFPKGNVRKPRDAEAALAIERASGAALENAGVRVDGVLPGGETGVYTHADGIADKLVRIDTSVKVPKYRKGGVAEVEQPMIGLLRDGGAGPDEQAVVGESGFEEPSGREPFRFQNPYAEQVDEETHGDSGGVVDDDGKEEEEAAVPKGLDIDTKAPAPKAAKKAGGSFVHSIFG